MPYVVPLKPDDPRRVGRYRLTGRVEDVLDTYDIPDIFLARAADGALLRGAGP
jgi:hypothetical protein